MRSRSVPAVFSAFVSPPASGSVTRRPLRVALPVARTVTPRALSACSVRALSVRLSEPLVVGAAPRGRRASATAMHRERGLHRAGIAIVNEPHGLPAG